MDYWYSPSAAAFFLSDFHNKDNIPKDCVTVTERDYLYIITQNHNGMKIAFDTNTNQPIVHK